MSHSSLLDPDAREPIGPYRLLEKLGEGGMGEVWLAEQTEPVRRTVALKVIKQGMDTRQVVARFEAERQALAMMTHPGIARVYDAGSTPRGRPYFAMEHVPGVAINEHCDRHRLKNRERLALFLQVCEAIQHAHQKAVIHRDLKPSNVLVTIRDDQAVPKIIDFGVAKAIGQSLTAQTLHTQLGMIVGTPAYMSPEQAELTGQDVDTRTDVYSLGVMLYELLVGALPFDHHELMQAGIEGIVRTIREVEPPRPSTRVSTLGEGSTTSAKARRTDLRSLKRELSGDLDWITLKALEKDRTRRYASPQDLAADIRRYLADEPVLASPPSVAYRARKFVRRHTWGVSAATAGVLALVAFAALMAVQARRIAAERDVAQRARADLESVVEFQDGILRSADVQAMGRRLLEDLSDRVAAAERAGGSSEEEVASALAELDALLGGLNASDVARDLLAGQVLGRAVEALEQEFSDRPLIDARLRHRIGWTYKDLGFFERAEGLLAQAVEIRERELGPDHPDTLASKNDLATVYIAEGRSDDAEPLLVATVEARERVLGAEHPYTLVSKSNLSNVFFGQSRYAEAEPLERALLESRKRLLGPEHPDTLNTMDHLAAIHASLGRHAEAEPLMLAVLAARKRVLGAEHPKTLGTMANLAGLYLIEGRHAEAEPMCSAMLAGRKRTLGGEHPDTLFSMGTLALVLEALGRYDEAEPLYVAARAGLERVLGAEHPATLTAMNNLGGFYTRVGDYERAAELLERAMEARVRVLGDRHFHVAYSHYNLGRLAAAQGRRDEALDHLRQALALGWLERRILEDEELDALRDDPEFEDIVAQVREKLR